MTRKFITLIISFLAVIISISAQAKDFNSATGFRISDKTDSSRFVIDFSQKPEYLVSVRKDPDRLVIEVKNTSWGKVKNKLKESLHVKNVRHNTLSNNRLQMVFDLKTPFAIKKYFVIPPKNNNTYRLVVDINPKNLELKSGKKEFIPIPKLKKVKKAIVVIDAGHGGHDPGTTGFKGSKEKNITLDYANEIKKELEKTGRYTVILTRKRDKYIDLKKRVEISRKAQANMFLSIHADSHNNQRMSGLSIYTLSEKASDKEAEELAKKENNAGVLNAVDVKGDTKDVTDLLVDMVQRESKNLSADFAENIIKEIRKETKVLYKKPHRFAGFRVLTAPDIPSALIELGYLSNPKEEEMLLSTNHKKKLAEAIVRAIDKHFRKYPVD